MKKERNTTADFAKGLAMLSILLDHIAGQGYLFATFHVPLFFMLSGYFSKEEPLSLTIRKKAKGLLLPYIEICGIAILLEGCYQRLVMDASWKVTMRVVGQRCLQTLLGKAFYLTWFLMALFIGSILLAVIWKVSRGRRWLQLSLVAGCSLLGYFSGTFCSLKPFQWDVALFSIVFLAVGRMAMEQKNCVTGKQKWGLFFLCLPIWIVGIHQGGLAMAIRWYPHYPFCVCVALAGSFCVIVLCSYAKRIPLLGTYLIWIGQNTLPLLCLGNITKNVWDWKRLCPVDSIPLSFLIQVVIFSLIILCWDQGKKMLKRGRKWKSNGKYRS